MKALIIIDVQHDFCEGGSLGCTGGNQAAEKISHLIDNYDVIVTTQDWHIDPGNHFSDHPDYINSWPVHCTAGSEGASLHSALRDAPITARFYKGHYEAAYSGFEGHTHYGLDDDEVLSDWLRRHNVTDIDIVGIATDYCVKATALDGLKEGFRVTVLSNFTAAVSAEGSDTALAELRIAGVVIA